jgi:acyl-CoA dehydrogenase
VEVAARQAADVDAKARFPAETLAALQAAGLMSAPIPTALGGAGASLRELGQLCATLAQTCGSSGMVLAMHYIQVGCLARHAQDSAYLRQYLRDLVREQWLLASMTSEVGTFGETRTSLCILVTARRDAEAATGDQVLVLVHKAEYQLTQTTTWDTMGMRGTCSPGFSLRSQGRVEQIVPVPYADIAAQTMVPYSHVLWAALWSGIAADAVAKAASTVRAEARKHPGQMPPRAAALADASEALQTLRHNWQAMALEFDTLQATPEGQEALLSMGWALRFNQLKIAASEAAPRIVHQALQIVGILGYKNDSPLSLSRQYRDALSGALMISNERIAAKNAAMLLVLKDD